MGAAYAKSAEDATHTTIHETQYGKIRGKKYKIENDRFVNVFLGIPYAQPPVGDLRFQKPEPAKCWPNVKECVKYSPRAPQVDNFFDRISTQVGISEDCLYLNVFAPEWDPFEGQEEGRAVLVWIHGGGFTVQSAATYGYHGICKYLCSKGVIVVTLQYRLGVLGFGATDTVNSIPNLGLWDQAFALKWVKNNIQSFGGNPNNITVFGQSAGAVCADILSLSPYTRELFHRVIPMGGSANCGWALRDLRRVRDATLSLAYSLGWQIPDNATEEMMNIGVMKFLKDQPTKSLALGLPKRNFKSYIAGNVFGPVIDGDFIPESISELRGKTPLKYCMTGATDYEVLLYAYKGKTKYNAKKAEHLLSEFIPLDKYCNDYPRIRHDAKQLYFTEHSKTNEVKQAYFQIASDLFVTNGVHDYAEDMLDNGHIVYLYSFEYVSPRVFGVMRWSMPFYAATHDTEIPFLFGKSLIDTFRPNSDDLEVISTFTTLFTNFAKCGDPNGGTIQGVERLTADDKWRYVRITKDVQMRNDFHGRRAEFWRNLREGKFLNETNSKETQTDDEASVSFSGSEKDVSVYAATKYRSLPIQSSYDLVGNDSETDIAENIKNTGIERNVVNFDTLNFDEAQPILLRYNELQFCNFERLDRNGEQNIRRKNDEYMETASEIFAPPSSINNYNSKFLANANEQSNNIYERRRCTSTTDEATRGISVLATFDDINVVNTNQNFILERINDLEHVPIIKFYYNHYYDTVDPGELETKNLPSSKANNNNFNDEDVRSELYDEEIKTATLSAAMTDIMCQQILQRQVKNPDSTTSTTMIIDAVEENRAYPELIGSTTVVCSAEPLLVEENDKSTAMLVRHSVGDVEVATQTSLDSDEYYNDEDRQSSSIREQNSQRLNNEKQCSEGSEWDESE